MVALVIMLKISKLIFINNSYFVYFFCDAIVEPTRIELSSKWKYFLDLQDAVDTECCADAAADDAQNTEDTQQELDVDLKEACPELSGQIIGGRPTSVNRHPYQVSMVLNGNSFCGGFIISRDYVLTAAHCVQK